jgi:hypothetical protein
VATFKVEKTGINKTAGYLLFNSDYELLDVSTSCLKLLGISAETISRKQIYFDVPTMFPTLKTDQSLLSKQGSQLEFRPPLLEPFNIKEKKDESNINLLTTL